MRWALQRQLPSQLLQTELEKALGCPVRYQAFHLSWDGRLVLDKVQLLDPQQKPFLKMEVAQLDFDRTQALTGKFVVQRLLLDHPDLELSGARWRQLAGRPSRPGSARAFPLVLRSLDLRWLDEQGKVSWQIQDWQGSLPPVAAGQWKVALQGPARQALEAEGGGGKTHLRLTRFSLSQLATVASGAHYSWLQESDEMDLDATSQAGAWLLAANLRSRSFSGPVQLQWKPGLVGELSSPGGQVSGLGEIKDLKLPFQPADGGWQVGPGQVVWRGAPWKMRAQVAQQDRFDGQLSCEAYPIPWPGGLKSSPAQVKFKMLGSLQQRQGDFQLEMKLPRIEASSQKWGDWSVSAQGRLLPEGLPRLRWSLSGPQGSWPGQLAWNAHSGDLKVDFEPLDFSRFLPGWKGTLQGSVQRKGSQDWNLNLQLPALSGPFTRVQGMQMRLAGSPPQWSGRATWNDFPLTLTGALQAPVVRSQRQWKTPNLNGLLAFKVAVSGSQLRVEAEKQQLSWRGVPLPALRGGLLGDRQGWKSDQLELVWPAFKLPLEFRGGWTPASWKLTGQLQPQPLAVLLAAVGSPKFALQGKASGRIEADTQGVAFRGELKGVKQATQDLGNWKVDLNKKRSQPGTLQLSNAALKVPQLGTLQAQVNWREGKGRPSLALDSKAFTVSGVKLGKARLAVQFDPTGTSQIAGQLGPASLNGWLDARKKTLALQGKLDGLNLIGLPGLPPGSAGQVQGQWRAQGSWAQPALELSGRVLKLRLLGSELGDVTLHATHRGSSNRLTVGPLLVQQLTPVQQKLPGLKGQLSADVSREGSNPVAISARLDQVFYQDRVMPDLSLKGVWEGTRLGQARLTWQVTPPLTLSGQIGLITRLSGTLEGQSLEALSGGKVPLQGQAFGKLSYGPTLVFDGELRHLAASGQQFGSGRLTLAVAEKIHLEGSQFEAGGVSLLQQRYPGLKGNLSFFCDVQGEAQQGTLKLRAASWRGQAFPEVTVEGKGDGVSWLLNQVQVGLNPPLNSNGRLWPASNRIELRGRLEGQSLADLALLSGGQPPPDLSGRLYGDYQLSAQQQQVGLHFQGQTRELKYRGVDLGNGQLQLQANPALQGQLDLQQPLEISRLSEVPGALKSILPAAGILGAIRLRGVTLGGSLDNPSVSPLWAAPQIRLRLPFP